MPPLSVYILLNIQVRYWQTTDDIRSATDVVVPRGGTEVTIWGIQRDTVYELRVLGYSRGGDGKMSEASFFTLGMFSFTEFSLFIRSKCLR